MPASLTIPASINAVIQNFDQADAPFTVQDVHQALSKARNELDAPGEDENFGAWAEVCAFALVAGEAGASPWGTYFGPIGSCSDEDGKTTYFPDIADANADVVAHWTDRAKEAKHPVIGSRYADLAWEMARAVGECRRDPELARSAIDAYLASVATSLLVEEYDRFEAVIRALDLACQLNDTGRAKAGCDMLMQLHREAVAAKKYWWRGFDRLIREKSAEVDDAVRSELVVSLEHLVSEFGDISDPQKFNPHDLEGAGTRLIQYYTRTREYDEVRRLHASIAKGFEHVAGLADAMAASSFLQTAVNAYRTAGMHDDCKRLRILMEKEIVRSRENMGCVESEFEVSREDIDKFCAAIVLDDIPSSFARLATEFLASRSECEQLVRDIAEQAPLMAHMPMDVIADDRIAAKIGSVDQDFFGRLVSHTKMRLDMSQIWLTQAIERLFEVHNVFPEHIAAWANRHGIFYDQTFLLEGARAWCCGDNVKAAHILVPQVESGLRGVAYQLGHPATKPHPTIPGVSVAVTMGDILYSEPMTEALGPDLTLHFLTLYADPRGKNLRNELAHGLIKPSDIDEHLTQLLIHTLFVFGVWKELAAKRR